MKTKRLFVDVPETFHREVKIYAVKKGLSLKDLLIKSVKNEIGEDVPLPLQSHEKGECCHA